MSHIAAMIIAGSWIWDSAGPQASTIRGLWWIFFGVLITVYLLVMLGLLAALRQKRAEGGVVPEQGTTRVVIGSVGVTVIILFVLLFLSVRSGSALAPLNAAAQVTVKVTGAQWWWKFEYEDTIPSNNVTTANELHIPSGKPIILKLTSTDVIHSFWVPSLHGKRDLFPGKNPTTLVLQADTPGTYRGQCAEFCGHQHAKMGLLLIVEPPEQFQAWLEHQRQPAAEPADSETLHGREVFLSSKCVLCHGIHGTPASATVAPDLTHVGSRLYIGSGSLTNTREHISGWIQDPHSIKPGVKMPTNPMSAADLAALVSYVESLK
jgi:cytochrome c oxidase subunit II